MSNVKAMVPVAVGTELAALTTAELRAELAKGLTLTAATLMRLGSIWAVLEARGEDLSDLRHGMARNLPLIASGQLAAEAVVAFAGRPSILQAIEGLPLGEQRRLAQGEPVEVATSTSSQRTELVPVTSIPAGRLRVVFQDGAILSPAEQRVRLGRKKRKEPEEEEGYRYLPHLDPATGHLRVGKMTVRPADLINALASASGPDYPPVAENEYVVLKVRLKHDEARQFLANCQRAELPEWEMIRKALRAFGMLS